MYHLFVAGAGNERPGAIGRVALYVDLGVRLKSNRRRKVGAVRSAERPVVARLSDGGIARWSELAEVTGGCGEVLTPTRGSYAISMFPLLFFFRHKFLS